MMMAATAFFIMFVVMATIAFLAMLMVMAAVTMFIMLMFMLCFAVEIHGRPCPCHDGFVFKMPFDDFGLPAHA